MTIRVLHVVEALTAGCARHVGDLLEHVDGVEHHTAVPPQAAKHRPDDGLIRARFEAAGAELHGVPMRRPPFDPRNAAALWRIRRLATEIDAHVVHAHSSIAGALARGALAASRRPVAYTAHGLANGRVPLAIERRLRPLTARFIAVSASEAADARRLRLVPDDRLVTIPNGIPSQPPPAASLHDVIGLEPEVPLIGTLGRLAVEKAPEVFVRAAGIVVAARPDVQVVQIGDGELNAFLHAEVAAAGLADRFHHVPHLPEAARYLGSLRVFLMTSRSEAGPYAPLEAMLAGTPVVVTDVRGCRDTVEDGTTGLVVAPEDPGAVAAAVLRVLDDPQLAGRLATAARVVVADRFNVAQMAAAHAALYQDLANLTRR